MAPSDGDATEPISDRPWNHLHCATWVVLIVLGGALVYSQCHTTPWWFSKDSWKYTRGWPFAYVRIVTCIERFYIQRFLLNVLVSLTVLTLTLLTFEKCVRKRFRFQLRTLFALSVTIAAVLGTDIRQIAWPYWEDWYIQVPLFLGVACVVYWFCWSVSRGLIYGAVKTYRLFSQRGD